MAWEPAPQRRVLTEHASFIYAFGNTQAVSLLREGPTNVHKALLLGFGDVRNVLATAAEAASAAQPAAGEAGRRRLAELQFDLCDIAQLNVARGLLLLHLASTLDPSNPVELDYLWGVSYCLRLPAAYGERLADTIRSLLQQPGVLRGQLPDAQQAAAIERVLQGWLDAAPRGVAEVEAERRRLVTSRLGGKLARSINGEDELRQVYLGQAASVLSNVLPWPPRGGGSQHGAFNNQALVSECTDFFMTGTIYRPSITAGAGGCVQQGSSSAQGGWVVNRTLLQPGSRKWLLHYGALPFASFLPLDPAKHAGIASAKGPRELTEACLEELASLLRGWQACRERCQVKARFWCCDALALCAGPLAAERAQQAEQRQGQGVAGYDVIDASNLSDHLGLLNVLTQAAPLLRRASHARLLTGHMIWPTGARTLHQYVRLACGVDPQLLPTLLGLRLMNDPLYGLERPHSPMTSCGSTDVHDVLEWKPEPVQPAAAPILSDGDGVGAALKAWCKLACSEDRVMLLDRSGLRLSTLLTLLHGLAGMAGRVRGLLPPGTASWRQLADRLAVVAGVPPTKQLELRALCCWALEQQAQQAQQADSAASSSGSNSQRPLLVRGRLPLSEVYRESERRGGTPLLAVHLVHIPPATSMPAVLADLAAMAQGGVGSGSTMRHMHVIDVVGWDVERKEVSFLLPPDHGLDFSNSAFSLLDASLARPLTPEAVPFNTLSIAPYSRPPPPSLAAGLRRLLREAAGAGAAGDSPAGAAAPVTSSGSSGSGVQLTDGLKLKALAEYADRFELDLSVEGSLGGSLSSSGMGLTFPGAPLGGGATQQMEVSLTQPAPLHARITFPWPIDNLTASIRVRSSARTVSATLRKSPAWPSPSSSGPAAAGLPSKLDVDTLPDWGQGEAAQGELGMHMGAMYSLPEMEAKSKGAAPGTQGSPMFDVRESLQALFLRSFQGSRVHDLVSTAAKAPPGETPEASLTLIVNGNGPGGVRRLPGGRPLLFVSYVDHDTARRLFPTDASKAAPLGRFTRIMQAGGAFSSPINRVNCTPQELQLLRFLLARNAAALRVPSWQSRLLELPSEWGASFLVPAYSDYVAEPGKGMEAMQGMMGSFKQEQQQLAAASRSPRNRPGSGSGSGSSSAAGGCGPRPASAGSSSGAPKASASLPTTAVRHKEAGNALFKQRQYACAVERYHKGIESLQRQQAQQGQQAQQQELRQLQVDMQNNLALALIRVAEADPAGATASLVAAEAACSAALELDAGNEKALYRRALARYKQGKAGAAQADLSAIPAGQAEDSAVALLRRQVQAALRL